MSVVKISRMKQKKHDNYETVVSPKARDWFRARPYQVENVAEYMSKKYDITKGVDADGLSEEESLLEQLQNIEPRHN